MIEIARLRNKRMVVRISTKVTALQHPGETANRFAARCNATSHYLMARGKHE